MSTVIAQRTQVGISNTPANNFTITAESANGQIKLARGNAGATTADIFTVDSSNNFTLNQIGVTKTTSPSISTTSTFSFNPPTNGQIVEITLSGAITTTIDVTAGSLIPNGMYTLLFKAGDTSIRTFLYNSTNVKMPAGAMPFQPSTNSGAYDIFHFRAISANAMVCVGYLADVR